MFTALLVAQSVAVVVEIFGGRHDNAERRAELMRDSRHELAFESAEFLFLFERELRGAFGFMQPCSGLRRLHELARQPPMASAGFS